jgi:hypothetical protein
MSTLPGIRSFDEFLRSGRFEVTVALTLFAALLALMTALKVVTITDQHGDTAVFFQTAENIAHRGIPVSGVFEDVYWYGFQSHLATMPAAEMAHDPLSPPPVGERNMFSFHAHLILYPMAAFTYFLPTDVVFFMFDSLTFAGTLLLSYFILRRMGVGILGGLLFCLLIVTHPAWALGYWGQPYPDRLFVLAGLVFMYLASRSETPRYQLVIAAVVAASVNERAAMTMGVFLLLYVLLYRRKLLAPDRSFKIAMGAALLAYGFLYSKLAVNEYYSTFMPTSIDAISYNLHLPGFVQNAEIFLLINAVFLAIAFFEWRAALIAAVCMLPNVLGNIGGAEKVGFFTHYHSYYFPVLLWATIAGYAAAYRLLSARRLTPALYAAVTLLVLFLALVDPTAAPKLSISTAYLKHHFVREFRREARRMLSPDGLRFYAWAEASRRAIPEGSVVTTGETLMPFIYRNRTIHFLPVGLDRADYAVLTILSNKDGKIVYGGVLTFLGPAEETKVNQVILQRMREDGYDFKHPALLIPINAAVLHRGGARPAVGTSRRAPVLPGVSRSPGDSSRRTGAR